MRFGSILSPVNITKRAMQYLAVKWFEIRARHHKPRGHAGFNSDLDHVAALRKEWRALSAIWRHLHDAGVRAAHVNVVHLRGHKSTTLQSTTLHSLLAESGPFQLERVRQSGTASTPLWRALAGGPFPRPSSPACMRRVGIML